MSENLSERFARSGGRPVRFGDLEVHNIYMRTVFADEAIRVHRLAARSSPVQAFRLKIEKGKLLVHGQELEDVVLWSDTAPDDVEIIAKVPKSGATLKVWNAWRDQQGTMQSWIGNAGMVIDAGRGRVTLRCSDGVEGPRFDDLIVELEFREG